MIRLAHCPKSGTGVSAGVFADNTQFRAYLFSAWKARVLDMESGAVVQVADAQPRVGDRRGPAELSAPC